MLQEASELYKNDPDIESFESNLRFHAVNRYFVNSEGTVVRSGQNLYENVHLVQQSSSGRHEPGAKQRVCGH